MSMAVGNSGQQDMYEINVTPMIDVLLVLLVIFLVIQPLLQKSIDIQVPIEEEPEGTPPPMIILEIEPGGFAINTAPVPAGQLQARLFDIFSNRPDKLLFVKVNPLVPYGTVVEAADQAKGAGVEVLGAMF